MDIRYVLAFAILIARAVSVPDASQPVDVSVLIPVTQENTLFLRNCLRSLFAVADEAPATTVEVIIFEVGSLSSAKKNFQRHDGIEYALESYAAAPSQRRLTLLENEDRGLKLHELYQQAVNASSGRYLLFLSEKTELSSGYFREALGSFVGSEDVGIVGSKLVKPDETIYHAGISFALGKGFGDAKSNNFWFNSSDPQRTGNMPLPYYVDAGVMAFDGRVSRTRDVLAVSGACFLIPADLYRQIGGYNDSMPDSYAFIDMCMRSLELGKRVVYSATAEALYFGEDERPPDANDIKKFNDEWGLSIDEQIRDGYEVTNLTLVWNMECGTGAVLGFTTEALGFMQSLERRMPVKIEVGSVSQCRDELSGIGVPAHVLSTLERLADVYVEGEPILVVHRDPGRYSNFIDGSSVKHPSYIIGRSMYETDRIPDKWAGRCNELVDEVWVPSQFNVETFANAGVEREKLGVLPEPVDVEEYNPEFYHPVHLAKRRGYNFLAVAKWEKRKNWDSLLQAFFDEFTATEDVALHIRSSLDTRNEQEYKLLVDSYLKAHEKNRTDLPVVSIIKDKYPFTKLPALYKAVDAVVSATHGEGWGLPLIEGMAMGLPVISTNWSGSTEFMNPSNSHPVPISGLVAADSKDHLWAQPNITLLRAAMREVFTNRAKAKELGVKARADVVAGWSLQRIGDIIIEKVKAIQARLPTLQAEKKRKRDELEKKKELERQLKKDKIQMKIVEH